MRNEGMLMPDSGGAAGQMASAILSPMAHKAEPEDAKAAFGGSGDVGSQPSRGGRPRLAASGGLFRVGALPP